MAWINNNPITNLLLPKKSFVLTGNFLGSAKSMFVPSNMLKPSVRLNAVLFVDYFCYYVSCVSLLYCLVCSCSLVIPSWEKADLLARLLFVFS